MQSSRTLSPNTAAVVASTGEIVTVIASGPDGTLVRRAGGYNSHYKNAELRPCAVPLDRAA
jgi:hypothetical protein